MPASKFTEYARRVAAAARRADADPTEAQREALNHRVGSVHLHGYQISITNPRGSVRRGRGSDGKEWRRVMKGHYGHIRRTTNSDGEHLDVFIGEHPESQLTFVVCQLDPDGNHDEYKAVMGCRNLQEAKKLYLDHYPDGWAESRMGEVRGYFMPQFREWLKKEKMLKKSASSHSKGYFCENCQKWHGDRTEEQGCPDCDRFKESFVGRLVKLASGGSPIPPVPGAPMGPAPRAVPAVPAVPAPQGPWGLPVPTSPMRPTPPAPVPMPRRVYPQTPLTTPLPAGREAAGYAQPAPVQPAAAAVAKGVGPPASTYSVGQTAGHAAGGSLGSSAGGALGASLGGALGPSHTTLAAGKPDSVLLDDLPPAESKGPGDLGLFDPREAGTAPKIDPITAHPELVGDEQRYLNAHTDPANAGPSAAWPGAQAASELRMGDLIERMVGRDPDRAVRFGSLIQSLHSGQPGSPRQLVIETANRAAAQAGRRPPATPDDPLTDEDAWDLFHNWAQGRRYPVSRPSPTDATSERGPLVDFFKDRPAAVSLPRDPLKWPDGLTARHELEHVAQGPEGVNELTPSLTDVAFLEEWVRRRQKSLGQPVTGSGATLTLNDPARRAYYLAEGPFDAARRAGEQPGHPLAASFIRDKAMEHGVFQGKPVSGLLNTNAGRKWLEQQAELDR